MSSDNIIHFKAAKKRDSYTKKEKQASENRVKFGKTKAEKSKNTFDKNKANTHLDHHKIDDA